MNLRIYTRFALACVLALSGCEFQRKTKSTRSSSEALTVAPNLRFRLDETAPLINRTEIQISFEPAETADPGLEFACGIDGAPLAPCVSPLVLSGMAEGQHRLQFEARLPGGSSAGTSRSWTVDTVAPALSISSAMPAPRTRDVVIQFSGRDSTSGIDPASLVCELDGVRRDCNLAAGADLRALGEGTHTLRVRASDRAANTGETSVTWATDTTPPSLMIGRGPSQPESPLRRPEFAFSSVETGASFQCQIVNVGTGVAGGFAGCTTPYLPQADLADGDYRFEVRASDPAGNVSASQTYAWRVRFVAPMVAITVAPAALSRARSGSFQFTGQGASRFECRVDAAPFVACSPSTVSVTNGIPYANLPDGMHTFTVRGLDAAGATLATQVSSWTIDGTPPAFASLAASAPSVQATTATLQIAVSDAVALNAGSLSCTHNGAARACTLSGQTISVPLATIPTGTNSVVATISDTAGNSAAGTVSWTADNAPPGVAIASTVTGVVNGGLTASPSAAFQFSGAGAASFLCRTSLQASFAPCAAAFTFPGSGSLGTGNYLVEVTAVSASGIRSATSPRIAWTVDRTPPAFANPAAPAATATASPVSITVSDANGLSAGSLSCSHNSAPVACALSGQTISATLSAIPAGANSFVATISDSLGNAGAGTVSWTATPVLGACPPRFTLQGNRCVPPPVGGAFQSLVGIYYVTMQCPSAAGNPQGTPIYDIRKIREGIGHFGGYGQGHWVDEPEGGYYCLTNRPDVLRRHAELLRDAGIQFIFIDATNHVSSNPLYAPLPVEMIMQPYAELLRVWSTVDGAPRVVPWAPIVSQYIQANGQAQAIPDNMMLWMMTELHKYPRMALMYEGGPFMLATSHPAMPFDPAVKARIDAAIGQPASYRLMWDQGQYYPNQWGHSVWCAGWGDGSFYNSGANGSVRCNQPFRGAANEQLSVSSAFNHYQFSVFGAHVPRFHGRTFVRMLERAWDFPQVPFIMINGWNEWGAGKWDTVTSPGHVGELNFVDNYSEERSRDMEPTRRVLPSGLPRDFYYNLLRTCISKLRQGVLCTQADGFPGGVGVVPTGTDGCTLHDCAGNGAAGAADIGDFDGGGTDYADFSKASATFYVHRNNGNGTFASGAGQEISVGVTSNGLDWIPVVGDFTCDGRADFIDFNRVHNMAWVHENLGASFTPQGQNWGSGTIYAPFFGMDVLAGDFNRDGCDDILTKNNRSGRIEIYLNTRNRAALFASPVIMSFVAQVGPQWRILVGDFDGDGYADVADQALTNGTFWVHRNQGPSAGYQFAMADLFFWQGTLDAANWQNWKTVLGDFDNDGYTDYADLYVGPGPSSGHFWIHRNLRNGTFTPGGQAAGEAQSFRPDANWKILGEP